MRKILLSFLFSLVSCLSFAQVPSGNVFVGYSYLNADLSSGRTSLNGWNASVEGKVLPFIGLVADFSGQYGSTTAPSLVTCPISAGSLPGGCIVTGNESIHQEDFLFGPRASIRVGKFRPFVHALIGAGHISESATGFSNSNTSFADALGGGLDYHLIPLISWRLQLDDVQTRFFSSRQDNIRFSTGIVFHF